MFNFLPLLYSPALVSLLQVTRVVLVITVLFCVTLPLASVLFHCEDIRY